MENPNELDRMALKKPWTLFEIGRNFVTSLVEPLYTGISQLITGESKKIEKQGLPS